MTREQWAKRQIRILLEAGVAPVVAEDAIRHVVSMLPLDDVNLAEWVPTPDQLAFEVNPASVQDARVAWYASRGVPVRYKRILDATR